MTTAGWWVAELAKQLALGTAWPAHEWADALAVLAGDPERIRWAAWLLHDPDCSPDAFLAAYRDAEARRTEPLGEAGVVSDLEHLARSYRELNELPPDAPLEINLGPAVAAMIAEQAAAEAAEYLAEQP
jgi:hypothetical protein